MNAYIERVLEQTRKRNADEPEFLQTVEEVLSSLAPVVNRHPEYEEAALLERMVEPERVIEFRVVWEDDAVACRSIAATASSATAPSGRTRAGCASTRRSTFRS